MMSMGLVWGGSAVKTADSGDDTGMFAQTKHTESSLNGQHPRMKRVFHEALSSVSSVM